MFLKLFDDTATMKLVNIGLAQSIEKYEPEKELSMKELSERKSFPDILKNGIRVIWNDQIQKENAESEDCYYSEQIFYGITFEQVTELLNDNNLYIRPRQKSVSPAKENINAEKKDKLSIKELIKDETPAPVKKKPAAPVKKKPAAKTKSIEKAKEKPIVE